MRSPRVGPWGPKVHGGGAARGARGGRAGFVRGHGLGSSSWWRPRAGGAPSSGMCTFTAVGEAIELAAECRLYGATGKWVSAMWRPRWDGVDESPQGTFAMPCWGRTVSISSRVSLRLVG